MVPQIKNHVAEHLDKSTVGIPRKPRIVLLETDVAEAPFLDCVSSIGASRGHAVTDGRIKRGLRTRKVIIEGYLGVAADLGRTPTAKEIGIRTGCSVRGIFEKFPRLDFLGAFDLLMVERLLDR